jgi:hypothetical protein
MFIRKKHHDRAFAAVHSHLSRMEDMIMAAIDDLKAEVATVATDVLAAIDKFTASLPPSQDPAIIQATADLKAAVKPLEDFVTPPTA